MLNETTIIDRASAQRIGALAERVLIVDPSPAAARALSQLLRDICPCQIWTAADAERGLALAASVDPHLIFVDESDGLDSAGFTRKLRRSALSCRKALVIVIAAEATASAILAARDAGAHEILRRPYAIRDLARRLKALTARPRPWIECVSYIGPDRRRFNCGDYSGPLRRRLDYAQAAPGAQVTQALRILTRALGALETDPCQALRSMLAQVEALGSAAAAMSDARLGAAAAALADCLAGADPRALRREDLAPLMADLWAYLPPDEGVLAAA